MTGSLLGTRPAAWAAAFLIGAGGTGALGGVAHAEDIDHLTAQQIADRSRDALLGAESLHVSTRGDLGKGTPSMSLDLAVDRSGNCNGSVDLGRSHGSVLIVKRGDDVWLKPDADFWKNQVPNGGSAFAAIVGDRYLKAPADSPRLRALTKACDLNTFQKLVSDNANDDTGTLNKGPKTTIDGTSVVPLTRMRGDMTLTVDVAATGKPYPLRLSLHGGDGTDAVVNLSDFDQPVPRNTPSPADSYDVSALLSRTSAPS
ncbi:hypothetical protein [Streptomyces drozdowiczii]|uniref:Lipoprotein n=1 Tax=Streptomyces drozdowiczii TaxID=202862 RepID=A0ABY6PMP3_9ACTN|nr:hypothetical protein [Streptomyces drozdowiczii]MCX0247067.1 hypothetical protein [Streptomyces drozdowiczii]UZK53498.1 hypothetical protein NEH16_04505 [Streptomyces drozdowiczii]